MRLWSIHPKYLDTKGLVALWREALLAKHVLEGRTKGYTNHPQLHRFKMLANPLPAINLYLSEVYTEALNRQYNFDQSKFEVKDSKIVMPVTEGQISYEFEHLLKKLQLRDPGRFELLSGITDVTPHPLFRIVSGNVEGWEVVS